MDVGAGHVLVVGIGLFGIGLFGLIARRHLAGAVSGLVLMTAGSQVLLAGFARLDDNPVRPLGGMVFALVAALAGAGQVLLAAGLLIAVRRRRGDLDADLIGSPDEDEGG